MPISPSGKRFSMCHNPFFIGRSLFSRCDQFDNINGVLKDWMFTPGKSVKPTQHFARAKTGKKPGRPQHKEAR